MSLNTSDPEFLKAARLVGRELGISQHDAARLDRGQFWEVANNAYREGKGGRIGGTKQTGADAFRDGVIAKMHQAEPSGKGLKPSRIPEENIPADWGDGKVPYKPHADPEAAAGSLPGGFGTGEQTVDLELCDGTIVRVSGVVVS